MAPGLSNPPAGPGQSGGGQNAARTCILAGV